MHSPLIERALTIASITHKEQVRKEGDIPYIVHPVMVALDLFSRGFSEVVIAAALVHDVLEDTEYPEEMLQAELGEEVMEIVRAVTNNDTLSWEDKKLRYIETVRQGPEGAKAVATADKLHNAQSLLNAHARLGDAVWENFNAGKEKKLWFEEVMLQMLKESWSHPLVDEYEVFVAKLRAL